MTEWSINCQPSRCARRAAISPPPLPYSREIVMARMAVMACGFTFIAFPPLVLSSHDKSGSYNMGCSFDVRLLRPCTLHTSAPEGSQRGLEGRSRLFSVRQQGRDLL